MVDLKKLLATKRAVIGTDETLKHLRAGNIETVFLSANCPETVKKDIEHYSKLARTSIEQLDVPNEEIGALCRKPFPISVLSVLKAKK